MVLMYVLSYLVVPLSHSNCVWWITIAQHSPTYQGTLPSLSTESHSQREGIHNGIANLYAVPALQVAYQPKLHGPSCRDNAAED